VLVERNDEVVDVLGFGGDLAKDDACSGEAGSTIQINYYAIDSRGMSISYTERWWA
jgi:hypothetical protein